ncbi:MAG: nitroreductase [Thiothrix sp.]|nr:MAG: nitroreductase [Thiothrix sp.]
MKVSEALQARKSTRAFLDKPVSRETLEQILDAARWAPSGTNTQPWQVAVLMGEKKRALQDKIESAYRKGVKGGMDYSYYPNEWKDPFLARRRVCGLQLYSALKIGKEDKERRAEQWVANYRSFDAPVMLLFFIDRIMDTGSYLDYGMFLQSIMLAAVEHGLATCPQAALGEYPDIVREYLSYDQNQIVVCGMALGYEDPSADINSYRTEREAVSKFTEFYID